MFVLFNQHSIYKKSIINAKEVIMRLNVLWPVDQNGGNPLRKRLAKIK